MSITGQIILPKPDHLGEFPTGGLVAMKFVQQHVVVSVFFLLLCCSEVFYVVIFEDSNSNAIFSLISLS